MNTALSAKTALKQQNQELLERFSAKESVTSLVSQRCRFVDELLIEHWQSYQLDNFPIALIAVGGYGRG